jgi:hypothetical protein
MHKWEGKGVLIHHTKLIPKPGQTKEHAVRKGRALQIPPHTEFKHKIKTKGTCK